MNETLFLKEKSFSFFLTYKKNRSDFSTTKKSFFLKKILQNIFEFLSLKTIFFYHHKTYLNFYYQKPLFLHITKQIRYFDKSKSIFLPIKIDLIIFKRRDFIHK